MDVKTSIDLGSNLSDLLQQLASKMGTTADKIFNLYVKQAHVIGWTNVVLGIGLFIVFISALCLVCKKTIVISKGNKYPDWDGENAGVIWVAMVLFSVFVFIFSMIVFPDTITTFANPEYWAVKHLPNDLASIVK